MSVTKKTNEEVRHVKQGQGTSVSLFTCKDSVTVPGPLHPRRKIYNNRINLRNTRVSKVLTGHKSLQRNVLTSRYYLRTSTLSLGAERVR